jgi:fumarate hydratase subunit beta
MTLRRITLPLSPDAARTLRAGEMVLLDGEIVITAGMPTIQRLLDGIDAGQPPPCDLRGAALFHLGSHSEDAPDGALVVRYMNPTTSTRFNAMMPKLIRHFGLGAVGGKGGLDAACAAAMHEVGCVYLGFFGGAAPLLTDAIRAVVRVDFPDMIAHYRLVTLRVEALGPVTVGIDAHGNSLYDTLQSRAQSRLPQILARLAAARGQA